MRLKPLEWHDNGRRLSAHPFKDCFDVELRIDPDGEEYTWDIFIGDSCADGGFCLTLDEAKAAVTQAYLQMIYDQMEYEHGT